MFDPGQPAVVISDIVFVGMHEQPARLVVYKALAGPGDVHGVRGGVRHLAQVQGTVHHAHDSVAVLDGQSQGRRQQPVGLALNGRRPDFVPQGGLKIFAIGDVGPDKTCGGMQKHRAGYIRQTDIAQQGILLGKQVYALLQVPLQPRRFPQRHEGRIALPAQIFHHLGITAEIVHSGAEQRDGIGQLVFLPG